MDHGGSIGGIQHHQHGFRPLARYDHDQFGRHDPMINFDHVRLSDGPFGDDDFARENEQRFDSRRDDKNLLNRNGFDSGGQHGVETLQGGQGQEQLHGISDHAPTISAVHGGRGLEQDISERLVFINRGVAETVSLSKHDQGLIRHFGNATSISAALGNTTLLGWQRDQDGVGQYSVGVSPVHSFSVSKTVLGWHGESGDRGGAVNKVWPQNPHSWSDGYGPHGSSWTGNDGTRITFIDYAKTHTKP